MKHPSTRALFAYWHKQRGTRPAPERADIDPADIRHQLGDTFILAADDDDRLCFRLAGTRVCALFGREIKGEAFAALWDAASTDMIETLMTIVAREQIGVAAGLIGEADDGAAVELEMILLPLGQSGHARVRALGLLAPLAPPYWLGEKPVTALTLGTIHYVGTDLDNAQGRRFVVTPTQIPLRGPLSSQWRERWQNRWSSPFRKSGAPRPGTTRSGTPMTARPSDGSQIKHGFIVYRGGRPGPHDTTSDKPSG
ncbi:MAG: PAS domain-containing protein [Rhodopseudomonas sp.]|nr:PAS domain-containing protein [Rhodopseudomonas sp.]